jgi:hypothetical protein
MKIRRMLPAPAFFADLAMCLMIAEHREMFGETARPVEAISTFGDLPLVVLAAGKPNPAFGEVAEEYQRYWIGQSRLWLAVAVPKALRRAQRRRRAHEASEVGGQNCETRFFTFLMFAFPLRIFSPEAQLYSKAL